MADSLTITMIIKIDDDINHIDEHIKHAVKVVPYWRLVLRRTSLFRQRQSGQQPGYQRHMQWIADGLSAVFKSAQLPTSDNSRRQIPEPKITSSKLLHYCRPSSPISWLPCSNTTLIVSGYLDCFAVRIIPTVNRDFTQCWFVFVTIQRNSKMLIYICSFERLFYSASLLGATIKKVKKPTF